MLRVREDDLRNLLLAGLIGLLALGGCASGIMRGYMGKSLQEAMLDYGPPANAFDMPDGSRAFQWVMSSTYVTPTTVTQYGTARPGGFGSVDWSSRTSIQGGQAITGTCIYTMLARWDDAANTWVFYDFRPPRVMCE